MLRAAGSLCSSGRATTVDSLRYAGRVASTVTPKLIDKALGRPRWNVAWTSASWRDVDTAKVTELPRRRGHFYADPFVLARDGRHYLFTEDYSRRAGRGRISVHEIADGFSRELGVALAEPFHLSFPYLFEHAGGVNDAVQYAMRDAMAGKPQQGFEKPSQKVAFGTRQSIPNVKCNSIEDARNKLQRAGFQVEVGSAEASECPKGTAAKTDPEGSTVKGGVVVIIPSSGQAGGASPPAGGGGGGGAGDRCDRLPWLCPPRR